MVQRRRRGQQRWMPVWLRRLWSPRIAAPLLTMTIAALIWVPFLLASATDVSQDPERMAMGGLQGIIGLVIILLGLLFVGCLLFIRRARTLRYTLGWFRLFTMVFAIVTAGLGLFASLYWAQSIHDALSFSEPLTKLDATYFTLTTFTTTGYGDIAAKSQAARALVVGQMCFGFVVLSIVIALALSRLNSE